MKHNSNNISRLSMVLIYCINHCSIECRYIDCFKAHGKVYECDAPAKYYEAGIYTQI